MNNYIKNYQTMTRDDDIVFFKTVLYQLYDLLQEYSNPINCELLPIITQKFMSYFQQQDTELLELILYCFGYMLQMLEDNTKSFEEFYPQLSMLLETENDKIETATLYVLTHLIHYLQYKWQIELLKIVKLPAVVERISKFGDVGRCYVVKFTNEVFNSSLFPSGDTHVYLE